MAEGNINARLKVLQPDDNSAYVNPVTKAEAVNYNNTTVKAFLDSLNERVSRIEGNADAQITITNIDNCIVPGKVYNYTGTQNTPSTTKNKWIIWAYPGNNMIVQYASDGQSTYIRTGTKTSGSTYNFSSWVKMFSLNEAYPIGAIYIGLQDINPSTLMGGSWERIEDEYFLRAASANVGTTGGQNSFMLQKNQLPPHKHLFHSQDYSMTWGRGDMNVWLNTLAYSGIQQAGNFLGTYQGKRNDGLGSRATSDKLVETSEFDEIVQQNINNQPAYINVYMWKRVA